MSPDGATIGGALREAAQRWGDGLALASRHQGIRWTWSELDAEVDSVATGLLRLGIGKGTVGIWAPNRAEWAVIQFATARIGAMLVTINPAYRTSEVEYALNKVGCRCWSPRRVSRPATTWGCCANWARKSCRCCSRSWCWARNGTRASCPGPTCAPRPIPRGWRAWMPRSTRNDAINIQFTSGTTGFPKGATLTHRNILNNGYFSGRTIRLTPDDRICIPVPLYHCFGMVLGNLAARPAARRWSIRARP
jgi:fatty-acyl-CoA synthase